jgi:hypothetical protein
MSGALAAASALAAALLLAGCSDSLAIRLGDPMPRFAIHGVDGAPVTDQALRGHVALLHMVNPDRETANQSMAFMAQARQNLSGLPVTFLSVAWDARSPPRSEAASRDALAALAQDAGADWALAVNNGSRPLFPQGDRQPVEVLLFDSDGILHAKTAVFRDPSCIVDNARKAVEGTLDRLVLC